MEVLKEEFNSFVKRIGYLIKWMVLAVICGLVMGLIMTAFYYCLKYATEIRMQHIKIIAFLPLAGLLIVLIYKVFGKSNQTSQGTNIVLASINSDEEMPRRMVPLIFITTVISHLFGASVGREGAALQMGGGFGKMFAKLLRLNENDEKILMICGMSAAFSALFGTPIMASVFAMEVISIGIMHYAALVPCIVSSYISFAIAKYLGVIYQSYTLGIIPAITPYTVSMSGILGLGCALVGILICLALILSEGFLKEQFGSAYLRILFCSCAVVLLTIAFPSGDYNGAGTAVIAAAFVNRAVWYAFLVKILFTAISLSGGFKGGEIIPSLFIGAVFGSFISLPLGLPVGICAACGMISVFCAVTNCPIASILMGIELFGSDALWFFVPAIGISYMISGYYGLYKSQKIIYSKYRSAYINRNAKR